MTYFITYKGKLRTVEEVLKLKALENTEENNEETT